MERQRDLRRVFPRVLDRAYELYKNRRLVKDVMSRDVVTIEPAQNMYLAARLMGAMRIGSIMVVEEDNTLTGIVTERDLLSKILAKSRDPKRVDVKSVMSSPLITINADASIKEAAQTMINQKGRLAVLEDETLVGIITATDLVKSLPDVPETLLQLRELMTQPVVTMDEKTPINEVARLMGEQRIGSIIATKKGHPTGIFTERDLLTTFIAEGRELDPPVGEYASKPILVSEPRISVHEAAYIMTTRRIKRLPLVDEEDNLVGIVTARDLVEAYTL